MVIIEFILNNNNNKIMFTIISLDSIVEDSIKFRGILL